MFITSFHVYELTLISYINRKVKVIWESRELPIDGFIQKHLHHYQVYYHFTHNAFDAAIFVSKIESREPTR